MKFEEALQELRKGAKIRHSNMDKDEYFMICRIGLGDATTDNERLYSIVRMKGNRQHDTMLGRMAYVARVKKQLKEILTEEEYKKYHNTYTELQISKLFDHDLFSYPHVNLYWILSDGWEVMP